MEKIIFKYLSFIGRSGLAVMLCGSLMWPAVMAGQSAGGSSTDCRDVTDIPGSYACSGECIVRNDGDSTKLVEVKAEVDVIRKYAGASTGLYQNEITGADNFSETEIGAMSGRVMRTATARVSDGEYPVLEEYVFDTDESCSAVGYTKIVRNPTQENFKACNIYCKKDS